MFRSRPIGLLLGALMWASSAAAQEQPVPMVEITYDRALALARAQAPALAVARARVREADSRVDAAAVWRFNPELSAAAGPRFGAAQTSVDWSASAQQWIELGGQRGDRVRAARAGAAAARARGDDALRLLLREVSVEFVAALYWQQRVVLAQENLGIAEAVAQVAVRRYELGDVGGLEQSAAELAMVRARSASERARAALTQSEGRLKVLLGIAPEAMLACVGDLRQLGMPDHFDITGAVLDDRADVRALAAEIRQAEAEAALGRSGQVPDLALGVGYAREESDHMVKGALTITLPVFERGQGQVAVADARRQRLGAELDVRARVAAIEANTAQAIADRLSAAARRFEHHGLGTVERAERLATAGYQAGAVPLAELLAVRRELVQAKLDYANLLFGAATARAELAASTGALQ